MTTDMAVRVMSAKAVMRMLRVDPDMEDVLAHMAERLDRLMINVPNGAGCILATVRQDLLHMSDLTEWPDTRNALLGIRLILMP